VILLTGQAMASMDASILAVAAPSVPTSTPPTLSCR
jgi:hypothetical protein